MEIGVAVLRARSVVLTQRIVEEAAAHGIRARTPALPERRGAMVCLDVPDAKAIHERLGEAGFDIDERPNAGLRLGPHVCVTEAECERAVRLIAEELDRSKRRPRSS